MDILVIGGTLFIGRRLVEALQHAGHTVTVLHRNPKSVPPPGVRGLLADRNDTESTARALAGRSFDAVFDNVYDWDRGTTAQQVEATALACAGPRLQRYVFMSSIGAYREALDLDENAPLALNDDPNRYAANKAASERALFAIPNFPAVTLRPPYIYGPGNPFYREAFFWDRLRDNRPILLPGDGSRLMQFVHVDDIVRLCLRILAVPDAVGQAFNVANESPVTQQYVVEAIARAAGVAARVVQIPREVAVAAGGTLMGPNLYFGQLFDLPPITTRIDKARRLLGFAPVPFEEGLRDTYEWWLANNPFPPPDYRFEDSLLNAIR